MLNLNCVICAELFSHSDEVHVTHCGHMFHFLCLRQWMERSKTCPQCRNKCSDRNVFRVYFNMANLDTSRVDVASLQEQLDNAKLQITIKDKEINKAEEQIKSLKDVQKKCMKTINGLEQKLQKSEFIILTYTEQMNILKTDAKVVDDLRKEVSSLKRQLDTMESVTAVHMASNAEIEKLLKIEHDPYKLGVWVTTLKRELRLCESKKTDIRNLLRVVQIDLRKEIEIKKKHEERIVQLESENYQLNEKLKSLEAATIAPSSSSSSSNIIKSKSPSNADFKIFDNLRHHVTISPTIKEKVKVIEDSNSPYLNIKSSSVGMGPFFRRYTEKIAKDAKLKPTTTKLSTLKISPIKSNNAAGSTKTNAASSSVTLRKNDYSIFKKPRLDVATATATSLNKTNTRNYVFNGLGGSVRVDPFTDNSDEEVTYVDDDDDHDIAVADNANSSTFVSAAPKPSGTNLSNRLKSGALRNFKINK